MANNTESRGQGAGNPQSSAVVSLSEGAIKKELRSDAMQHPMAILPFTLVILSIIYLILFSPVLGGAPVAIVLLIVSGVVAGGAFFWRYLIRFNEEYARKALEVMARLDQASGQGEESELRELRDVLQGGFSNLNTNEGLKALNQLNYVYDRLQPVLESKRVTDPMAVAHIPPLAEETYRRGLSVLSDALELMSAIH